MAYADEGASQPTSYYTAPSSEPRTEQAQDQNGDNWSWDSSGWNWGDRWAGYGWWLRSYGRYKHWPWGSGAEWSDNSFQFHHGSHDDGDDGQGSGSRSEDHPSHEVNSNEDEARRGHRRASWNSSGAWTGDESTRATTSAGVRDSVSDASVNKGSVSEKMAVPKFDASGTGDELGVSARSYLRQVDAWVKVTKTPSSQQALILYQHLSGRAWVESEELNVDELAGDKGLMVFRAWISERYQEVEVSKIAESLTAFFKRLKRQPGQTIREFNSTFDRSHSRLLEIDCRLPEVAKAWAYLNSLGLTSSEELSLLASVGNDYNTTKLQRAAVLHEKSLRPPWQPRKGFVSEGKGVKNAYMTEADEVDEGDEGVQDEDGDAMTEEEAVILHEAFVAQETAKAKYREVAKARGVDPRVIKDSRRASDEGKQAIEDRLASAKARSFCAGCGRKGHWHKDSVCPLNSRQQKPPDQQAHLTSASTDSNQGTVVQVAYEVGNLGGDRLLAITDTACSKSVTGQRWLDDYLKLARASGVETQFINSQDDFRFGASKLFRANYTVSIAMEICGKCFVVRASVVDGEVPLLLSRKALSKLGMVYDIENHTARFKHLGIDGFGLLTTDNGHPAIQVNPKAFGRHKLPSPQEWDDDEVKLFTAQSQYMVHGSYMTSDVASSARPPRFRDRNEAFPAGGPLGNLTPKIFYPKKINAEIRNMLCAASLNTDLFAAWWGKTAISKDFWIETPNLLIRVHVVPRRGFFDPTRWTTNQAEIKQELLATLGEVRCASAITCSNTHGLCQVHDAWRVATESQHPVLWVGRTTFSRAAKSALCDPIPTVSAHPPESDGLLVDPHRECVAHEQGPVALEGGLLEHHGAPIVEHRRAPAVDSGEEKGQRGCFGCAQGSGVHEQVPTPGAVQAVGDRAPGEGNQRGSDFDDQGCMHQEQRGCGGGIRAPSWQALPRGPGELPQVGHPGGEGAWARGVQPGSGEPQHLCGTCVPRGSRNGKGSGGGRTSPNSSGRSFSGELGRGRLERAVFGSQVTEQPSGADRCVKGDAEGPYQKLINEADLGTKGRDGGEKDKMNQDVPPEVKAEMEALMTRLAALKDKFGL